MNSIQLQKLLSLAVIRIPTSSETLRLSMFLLSTFLAAVAVTAIPHHGHHGKDKCPPFSGNFTIHQYQLYPENADFDFNSCLLYIGYVASLVVLLV